MPHHQNNSSSFQYERHLPPSSSAFGNNVYVDDGGFEVTIQQQPNDNNGEVKVDSKKYSGSYLSPGSEIKGSLRTDSDSSLYNASSSPFYSEVTLIGELPSDSSPVPTKFTHLKQEEEREVGFQLSIINPAELGQDHSGSSTFLTSGGGSTPTEASNSSRAQHIDATKDVFSDSEKLAYVGLCKVYLVNQAMQYPFKFTEFVHANASYTLFAKKLMRKLYRHLALSEEEEQMIEKLSSHGVLPQDFSRTILQGCLTKVARFTTSSALKPTSPSSVDKDSDEEACTTTMTIDIRWTIILDLFLLMTNEDIYDSRSRMLLKAIAEELELDWFDVIKMEKEIAEQFQIHDVADTLKHNSEIKGRKKTNFKTRMALMGVASVGGGLIIGLSAGLLAPLIGSGLGAAFGGLGLAGSSAFFGSTGGAALITTGGVVTGSTIAGQKMEKRTRGVDIFQFYTIHDHSRASVLISITGWLPGKGEDVTKPFAMVDPLLGDHFSLLWEPEALKQLGNSLKLLAGEVLSFAAQEILKHTLLSALMAALTLPMALAKLGYLVDNPWSTGLSLAEKAGKVLADVLLNHAQGHRPVSLVGFSLGARVIFYCLLELSRVKAYGIIENVYIFGAPVTASKTQWREAASIVAGKFINGHVKSDWILGYLYRAAGTTLTIAGLHPVLDVAGVENKDVTQFVSGHLAYRHMMPTLMKECGIPVLSESFEDEEEGDELEVSDNLEAVMAGANPSSGKKIMTHQPGLVDLHKKSNRSSLSTTATSGSSSSWFENPIFGKLKWSSKAQQPTNTGSSTSITSPTSATFMSVDPNNINEDEMKIALPTPSANNRLVSDNISPTGFDQLDLQPPGQARTKFRS